MVTETKQKGSLDGLDEQEVERSTFKVLKKFTTTSGVKVEIRCWIDEEGKEGQVQVRLSRKWYSKKKAGYEWDNINLYGEDLHFLTRLTKAMLDSELIPLETEIKLD